MPSVVLLAIVAISLSVAVMAWSVLAGPDRVHERTVANLQRGLQPGLAHAPAPPEQGQRGAGLGVLARRLTPGFSVRLLERLLVRAGRPPAWPVERLLAAKLVLGGGLGALSLLYVSGSPSGIALLVGAGVTVVGYFLPELLLHSRGQERSQQIALELADTLDQMTIAVEAGLGFDSAMARAGKNGTGPLAQEMVRTLQDIQVGQSRRQAYEALATRTDVADLRRFVRAVIQADMYGIAVADVLRTQAAEMRMKRRQRAEEKAMQIPVKVIFPLISCILPVLFIVLLGPAVMDIMEAFS
ncbi:type II secretion system F family protein [Georgenia sp. MJ206]|uniref:type II secretion system F family protein n=1 Tax=Georgenia wangjunii TaxID=3117730 RepID=UPI002F2688FD